MEVLRWARENGAPWTAVTRDWAAAELGYTDDFGNLSWWDDDHSLRGAATTKVRRH